MLPSILEALIAFERIRDLAKQTGTSLHVGVGISPCVGIRMAEIAFEFAKAHRPDIEIVYREANLLDLCELMKRSQIDVILAPLDIRSQSLPDCIVQRLYTEPLFFIPRREDRRRWMHARAVTVKEIADEQFVLVPNACGLAQVTKRLFDDNCSVLKRYPGEASSYAVVEEWANMGLGSGILPASKVSESSKSFAIPILDDGQPATIEYFAIGKPNTIPSTVFTDLWEMLQVDKAPSLDNPSATQAASTLDWCV